MAKRILFLIRGKLGDSLVAYSVFQKYVSRHPHENITLLIRKNYAELLRSESGFRLVPYRNRLQAITRILAERLLRGRFDVFAVLWGFGGIVPSLARAGNARRRLYLDGRYRASLPEYPNDCIDAMQVDPAWRVARLLDAELDKPDRLNVQGLAARRARQAHHAIGVTPLADEPRRNMNTRTLKQLLEYLRARHPDAPLYIFLNPGEETILPAPLPADTEVKIFHTLPQLVNHYTRLAAWYGTDTGLYHLAAAMNIPCHLFFGPTQPRKIMLPAQDAHGIRLQVLGDEHCEEKQCTRPACLELAVMNHCGAGAPTSLDGTPAGCPLRRHEAQLLQTNKLHENTRHQAR